MNKKIYIDSIKTSFHQKSIKTSFHLVPVWNGVYSNNFYIPIRFSTVVVFGINGGLESFLHMYILEEKKESAPSLFLAVSEVRK